MVSDFVEEFHGLLNEEFEGGKLVYPNMDECYLSMEWRVKDTGHVLSK